MAKKTDGPGAEVLIVGAVPTGLVLALWLTRLGVRIRIFDQTKEPGTTSRAMAIQARTLEFYGQLGFADKVVEQGRWATEANMWVNGAGKDNFVPLKSLDWQMHIYGDATPEVRALSTERRLPLHIFSWSKQMAQSGLRRNALYLVRTGRLGRTGGESGSHPNRQILSQ